MDDPPSGKKLILMTKPRLNEDREAFTARVKKALREKGLLKPSSDDSPPLQSRQPGPDSPA